MPELNPQTRDKLGKVATPTLMTALYKRGLRNQWIQDVHLINPAATPMVGTAFTLRYMPAREDLNPIEVFRDRNHPQRVAVEQCPPGAVLVIDSRKDPRAASAGSILITRLMVRGCAGVVTDGGFRDTPELKKFAFPAYHNRPSSPTNLTLHQAIEINGPIGCGDAPVFPGDVIVGDGEGGRRACASRRRDCRRNAGDDRNSRTSSRKKSSRAVPSSDSIPPRKSRRSRIFRPGAR
jgi:regulator of RNase E activity RraA